MLQGVIAPGFALPRNWYFSSTGKPDRKIGEAFDRFANVRCSRHSTA
jgi:hypothetical protein